MKLSKKFIVIAIGIMLIVTSIVGCSGAKTIRNESTSSSDRGVSQAPTAPGAMPVPESPQEKAEAENDNIGIGAPSPLEPEKIITTINLSFETTEFEKTNDELNKLITKYKGYIEYSNISYNHYYDNIKYRYGEFAIRVPRENIVSFKTELSVIGNLTGESTNKQDVTKQYRDTESRLKVVEIKEERLLSLLEKAEKIEDIIALENQLSEVIYEKESLKSSLMTLDDKVDFSTVYVNIQEVAKITNTETIETTFGTKIKNAINNSLYFFKDTLEGLIIALIYLSPFLIIFGVVIFVVVKWFRKIRKNKI